MADNRFSGAEAMVRLLQLHGVRHVFGLCGDTSLPFYDALRRLGAGMTHILTRDERSAAYMADGYARVSGRVGVCEGPSGGGATYILPGVVEANESSIPVLAITTDIATTSRGHFTLTELDQAALFRPLSKWNRMIDRASDLPSLVREAFRQMTSGRPGAAHLGLPFDVQNQPVEEAEIWADPRFGTYPAVRTEPDPAEVEAAARLLLAAKSPLFVCGGGVVIAGAEDALLRCARALDAPVATSISGQGSISAHDPLSVGVVGSNGGTAETRSLVEAADLVAFVGCRAGSITTERRRYPAAGQAKILHIDADARVFGANYEPDVALEADAKLALEALADALERHRAKADRGSVARIAAAKRAKFDGFRQLAQSDMRPIRPERIVAELQALLPDEAVLVCDPGTPCPYFSAYYEFAHPGRHFISNRAHGALGYSMAAAVGAAYGRPGVPVLAIMGDGSFGFTAGELETIVRYKVPVTMLVLANSTYGWIKAGQKSRYESQYFSVDFSRTDHARVAEAFGVRAWSVQAPADLRPALQAALESGGPALVDIETQPLHEARAPVSEWVA
jgi:acetolactate synthase-1/2/3 large subunit